MSPLEVNVIEHLNVVRLGAASSSKRTSASRRGCGGRSSSPSPIDTDERRVTAVTGHEVRVRIGAVVEQRRRDGDAILVHRREWKSRERMEEEGLQVLRRGRRNSSPMWPAPAVIARHRRAAAGELRIVGERPLDRPRVHRTRFLYRKLS